MIQMIEPFEDSQGNIVLAIRSNSGTIEYLGLGELEKRDGGAAKYVVKMLNHAVWPMYPDPRPFMECEDRNLLVDIEKVLKEFIYLPREELYNTLALWVLFTNIHDHEEFDHAARLLIQGIKKTGKSRLMALLSFLAYRGYRCYEPSEAGLFRVVEKFHATPFIDEIQSLDKDQKRNVEGIIRAGFDVGMKILRASADSEWPITYAVYGPMCAGGMNWSPPDEIVQRSIKVETINKPRHIRLRRRKPHLRDVPDLRARLLAFRLKVMSGAIPIESAALEVEEAIENDILIEDKTIVLDDRGLDIAYSLGMVGALFDDYQDMLKEVARTQANASAAAQNAFQTDVLRALLDVIEVESDVGLDGRKRVNWSSVTTRTVKDQLIVNLKEAGNAPEKEPHARTVLNILRDHYGFDMKVEGGAGRTTVFDPETFWNRLRSIIENIGLVWDINAFEHD